MTKRDKIFNWIFGNMIFDKDNMESNPNYRKLLPFEKFRMATEETLLKEDFEGDSFEVNKNSFS